MCAGEPEAFCEWALSRWPHLTLTLREVLLLTLFHCPGSWGQEARGLRGGDGRAGIQSSMTPERTPQPVCDIASYRCLCTKYLSSIKKSLFPKCGLRSLFSLKGEERTKGLYLYPWWSTCFSWCLTGLQCFSSGSSNVSFKSGSSSSAPYVQPHLSSSVSSVVSQGIVPAYFQFVSLCLFPTYNSASMILEPENGQQNMGLSSGELSVLSQGNNRKLLWIPLLDRLSGWPLSPWMSPIVQLP